MRSTTYRWKRDNYARHRPLVAGGWRLTHKILVRVARTVRGKQGESGFSHGSRLALGLQKIRRDVCSLEEPRGDTPESTLGHFDRRLQ